MSAIEEAIREHVKLCNDTLPSRFVPWVWVVGIAVTLVGGMGSVAWGLSRGVARAEFAIEAHTEAIRTQQTRIDKLEAALSLLTEMRSDITAIRRATASGPWQRHQPTP